MRLGKLPAAFRHGAWVNGGVVSLGAGSLLVAQKFGVDIVVPVRQHQKWRLACLPCRGVSSNAQALRETRFTMLHYTLDHITQARQAKRDMYLKDPNLSYSGWRLL